MSQICGQDKRAPELTGGYWLLSKTSSQSKRKVKIKIKILQTYLFLLDFSLQNKWTEIRSWTYQKFQCKMMVKQ